MAASHRSPTDAHQFHTSVLAQRAWKPAHQHQAATPDPPIRSRYPDPDLQRAQAEATLRHLRTHRRCPLQPATPSKYALRRASRRDQTCRAKPAPGPAGSRRQYPPRMVLRPRRHGAQTRDRASPDRQRRKTPRHSRSDDSHRPAVHERKASD